MRPRPVPWRTKNSYTAWKDVTPASMRPRPVPWRTYAERARTAQAGEALQCGHGPCRGERSCPILALRGRPASMRPRPSCRGERLRCRNLHGAIPTFNAATAFVPWRTPRGTAGGGRWTVPFNAATARAVENLLLLPLFILWRYHLQCGHGLRAVENGQANTITVAALAGLQCGHGPCRGERLRPRTPAVAEEPSMRPRPSCRGERQRAVRRLRSHLPPSMRPRPSCRGEPEIVLYRAALTGASMRPRPSCRGEPPAIRQKKP